MGMDVIGENPKSETGAYFRRSCWGWAPLWSFCEDLTEAAKGVRYGHSNDGDGLNAGNSEVLAAELLDLIEDGTAADYIERRDRELAALPDEVCFWCEGTGTRVKPVPGDPLWKPTPGYCNGCLKDGRGTGKVRPHETHYSLTVDDLKEFAAFLKDCGGFEIC